MMNEDKQIEQLHRSFAKLRREHDALVQIVDGLMDDVSKECTSTFEMIMDVADRAIKLEKTVLYWRISISVAVVGLLISAIW